jgi:hypothetical protein
MSAPDRRVRVIGERRDRIDLRALADLLVAAADSDPNEDTRDAGPSLRWQHQARSENDSTTTP